MKSFIKVLGMLLLFGALAGGVYLVNKNQETRRGATANDTVISFLPASGNFDVGKTVPVSVWINTGKATDMMSGAELSVSFDRTKLKYLGFQILDTKYSVLQDGTHPVDSKSGPLTFTLVALGNETGGAVNVLKVNFESIGSGSAKVGLSTGNILVNGQATTWLINTVNTATYVIGGNTPTVTLTPTKAVPTIGVPPLPGCNMRCGKIGCASGLVCVPLNVPLPTGSCGLLPIDIETKLEAGSALSSTDIIKVKQICPDYLKSAMGYDVNGTSISVSPTFVGVCRKISCLSNVSCGCEIKPTCIPRPACLSTVPACKLVENPNWCPAITPTPTVATGSTKISLVGSFEQKSVSVGGSVVFDLRADGGAGVNGVMKKVSAVDVRIKLMSSYFDIIQVIPNSSATVLKNEIGGDATSKWVTLSLVWNLAAAKLPVNPSLVKIGLTAKSAGVPSIIMDTSYTNQITGVDEFGKSVSFIVTPVNGWMMISPVATVTPVPKCQVCASGVAKSKGNANCDNKADLLDFEYWRNEAFDQGGMTGKISTQWMADFNCDSKVDLLDFETWRFTVFP